MEYAALEFWFSVFIFVFNVAVAVYVYLASRQRATQDHVDTVTKEIFGRINEVELKAIRLESDIEHLPGKAELHEVSSKVENLSGELKGLNAALNGMTESFKTMQSTLASINTYLLENK